MPLAFLLAACAAMPADAVAQARATEPSPLAGTWTLVAADLLHPDGSRTRDYGAAPKGRLIVDARGRYSLQIFKSERPRFASDDKTKGTPAEFAASTLGSSTHFGSMDVDPVAHVLTVSIDGASFPNQEGTQQKRTYVLDGDELSYRVPARPDGNVPISVWHREKRDAWLVGTWALTSVDNVSPDGSRVHLFGDNPQGILTFDGSGHYTMQILRADRPKFATNDRNKGTPEENQAAVNGANTHFGTYSVNEADHVVTFALEHAFFPNWEGRQLPCSFTLSASEFSFINPSPSSGSNVKSEVRWHRVSP